MEFHGLAWLTRSPIRHHALNRSAYLTDPHLLGILSTPYLNLFMSQLAWSTAIRLQYTIGYDIVLLHFMHVIAGDLSLFHIALVHLPLRMPILGFFLEDVHTFLALYSTIIAHEMWLFCHVYVVSPVTLHHSIRPHQTEYWVVAMFQNGDSQLVLPDRSILEEYVRRKRDRGERLHSEPPIVESEEIRCSPCLSTASELIPASTGNQPVSIYFS